MHAAEIVPRNEDRDCGLEICQLFAEAVCQARESPQVHPYGQVHPLDVGCRNAREFRTANTPLAHYHQPLWVDIHQPQAQTDTAKAAPARG